MGNLQQTLVDAFSNVKYLIGYIAGATGLSTLVVAAIAISLGSKVLKTVLKVMFIIFAVLAVLWFLASYA